MLVKVQGYANAQSIFDAFNGKGLTWGEPVGRNTWHVLRINIKTEDYESAKQFLVSQFPDVKFSFK